MNIIIFIEYVLVKIFNLFLKALKSLMKFELSLYLTDRFNFDERLMKIKRTFQLIVYACVFYIVMHFKSFLVYRKQGKLM